MRLLLQIIQREPELVERVLSESSAGHGPARPARSPRRLAFCAGRPMLRKFHAPIQYGSRAQIHSKPLKCNGACVRVVDAAMRMRPWMDPAPSAATTAPGGIAR